MADNRRRNIDRYHPGNNAAVKLLSSVALFSAPPLHILLMGPAMVVLCDFVNRVLQNISW